MERRKQNEPSCFSSFPTAPPRGNEQQAGSKNQRRTSIIGRTIDEAIKDQTSIGWLQALQGRISSKWREAEALATGQEYNALDVGIFPAFIRMLWRTSKNIWLARNLLQHGATPEARLKKQKDKLINRITKLYRSEKHTVSFLN